MTAMDMQVEAAAGQAWLEELRDLGVEASAEPLLSEAGEAALAGQMQSAMDAGDYQAALEPGWLLAYADPWNRDHAMAFALCLQHVGDWASACRFYSIALMLDATDAYCAFRIGECLAALGELADARAAFESAVELSWADEAFSEVRAVALHRIDAALGEEPSAWIAE